MIAPALAVVLLAAPGEWTASGWLEEDARAGFPEEGDAYWERIQSSVALRLEGEMREHGLRVVADGRVLHRAEPDAQVAAFGERVPAHPWRLDGDALFVEARRGAGWIRLGRQSVRWGRGLVAAPTSVISPPDLEDPLRFGAPRGAEMLRVLAPAGPLPLKIELIAVHAFRPALLAPVSARDALANSGQPAAENIAADPAWTVDVRVHDPPPPATFANTPLGARVTGNLPFLETELGLSWYRGRSPIPEVRDAAFEVDLPAQALTGDVRLVYPRMQMFGADAAAEIPLPFLDGDAVAVFAEAAWIVPEGFEQRTSIPGTEQRVTVLDEPYARGVAGIERAGDTVLALEWSRGFFDEYGEARQRDYVFAVAERRFLRETISVRVVGAACLDDGSKILAPDIAWSPRDALTLSLAAYASAGSDTSKFAGPLAGDPVALARARASF